MRTLVLAAGLTLAAGAAVGAGARGEPLTVFAASSLTEAFTALDRDATYSFAGSNALATQVRNGAPADVFASAAPRTTQALFRARLVERPVTFAGNRLVLIVPRSNPAGLATVYDLRRKPVKLVVAGPAVPAGGYTRIALRRLGLSSVLSKVVSIESDVKAVTGKVALGQADAGFVYATDVRPVSASVRVIRIPARGQPRIRYEIAVVSRSDDKARARAWVRTLLAPRGQLALRRAGFAPAPKAAP